MYHDLKVYSKEKRMRIIAHHAFYGVIIHLMLVGAFLCGRASARRCDGGAEE